MRNASNNPSEPAPERPIDNRERLKVILMGSKQTVTIGIHTLYSLGFAEATEWSCLLPAPKPGEVMTILLRKIPKK